MAGIVEDSTSRALDRMLLDKVTGRDRSAAPRSVDTRRTATREDPITHVRLDEMPRLAGKKPFGKARSLHGGTR